MMRKMGEENITLLSPTFNYYYEKYPIDFLRMIIFDCLTLNIDRNIDNFGEIRNSKVQFAPLFDHDECFKGRSLDEEYYVTGVSFALALQWAKKEANYAEAVYPFKQLRLESIMHIPLLEEKLPAFKERLRFL